MSVIGGWDNANNIWVLSPSWLKAGPNPADFNSGAFPLHRGPSGGSETASLVNFAAGYGYVDGHFRFDGVNDKALTTHNPTHTNASKLTTEIWLFFVAGKAAPQDIISNNDDADNNVILLGVSNVDKLRMRFESATAVDQAADDAALTTGLHHLVSVKDGGDLKLYIDGSEIAAYGVQQTYALGIFQLTAAISLGLSRISPSSHDIYFGAMYDDALTPARIAANYALGPEMGGVRGTNATPMVLTDPADDRPTPLEFFQLGDKEFELAIRYRGEYSHSAETFVPLSLNLADIAGSEFDLLWDNVQANGSDLRMAKADGTEIPMDVISIDTGTRTGHIKFRHPAILNGTDAALLYLQWGGVSTRATTDTDTYKDGYGGSIDHIFYFAMEEASGNAIDRVGNYVGTVSGVTYEAEGQIEKGYLFDVIDNVNIGTVTQLSNAAAFSFLHWMKQTAVDAFDRVFDFYIDANNAIEISTNTGGNGGFRCIVETAGSNSRGDIPYVDLGAVAGMPVMMSCVFDGSGVDNPGRLQMYQNGIGQTISFAGTIPAVTPTYTSETATFGHASANPFAGVLDEARAIAGVLSDDQVKIHYDNEKTFRYNSSLDISLPVPLNRVQWKNSTLADPASVTLDDGPIEGNLLIAVAMQRSETAHANFVLSGITGWTKAFGEDISLGDATYRMSWAVYYKIAGAGESSTINFDDGTANSKLLTVAEYRLVGDETAFLFLDEAHASDAGEPYASSPLGTGDTSSCPGTRFLLLSSAAFKYASSVYPTSVSWATTDNEELTDGTDPDGMRESIAYIPDTTPGIHNDSCTFNGNNRTVGVGILVFRTKDGLGSWSLLAGRNPLYNDMNSQLSR